MDAELTPWISVPDVPRAVDWYAAAFGAVARERHEDESGHAVVALLAIGAAPFWLGEDPGMSTDSGCGPIRMILTVADPDAVYARAVAAGATAVTPVYEGHGWRIGRLADPFGHHWEVGRPLGG